jgi:chlorophyll synthase
MALPQMTVVWLLLDWGRPLHAGAVALVLGVQIALMVRFLAAPVGRATWYSALGVSVYVTGMMVSAFALGGMGS